MAETRGRAALAQGREANRRPARRMAASYQSATPSRRRRPDSRHSRCAGSEAYRLVDDQISVRHAEPRHRGESRDGAHGDAWRVWLLSARKTAARSEEHTSELT